VSIGGIRGPALAVAERSHPDKQADAESRSDIKWIDHVHTICGDICGYLMTPQFLPQCTLGNKNVSAAQKGWVVILPTSRASNGIVVLSDLARKSSQFYARFGAMNWRCGATSRTVVERI
jgi:hypothetical protein